MLKRYVYDPTGRSPDNLIKRELHTLVTEVDGTSNGLYFPRYGAYYGDSIVVTQGKKTLVKNQDWQYAFFWQDVSDTTGQAVFLAIQIINPNLIGNIELKYQVVGGDYSGRVQGIDKIIQHLPKQNRNVFWDDVINKPEAYIPARHWHDIVDVFGLSPLVLAINELRDTVSHGSVLKLKTVYDRFLKLKQYVESLMSTFDEKSKAVSIALEELQSKLGNLVSRQDVEAIVESTIDDKVGDVIHAVDAVRDEITSLRNDVDNKLEEANTKLSEMGNKVSTVVTQMGDLRNNLTTSQNELENRLNTSVTVLRNEVAGNITNVKNAINNAKSELTNYVDNATRTLNENITAAKRELSNDISSKLTNQNNDINQRINNLETSLTSTNEKVTDAVTKLNNNVTLVKENIEDIRVTIDNNKNELQGNIDNLANTVTNNKSLADGEITRLDNRLNVLTDKVSKAANADNEKVDNIKTVFDDKLNQLTDNVNEQISTQADKLDAMGGTLQDYERRITANTDSISNVAHDVSVINDKIDNHYRNWELTKEYIDNANNGATQSLIAVNENITNNANNITKVDNRVDALNDRITNVNEVMAGHVSNLTTNVTNLENRVSTLETEKDNIKVTLGTHDSKLSSLEQFKEDTGEKLIDLTGGITNIDRRIDDLQTSLSDNVTSINTNVTNLNNNLTSVTQAINDLEPRVKKLENKVPVTLYNRKLDRTIRSGTNVDKYYPIEIHGLKVDERIRFKLSYSNTSTPSWVDTSSIDKPFLYLEWQSVNEKNSITTNGNEVEAFTYSTLTSNQPPVMNLNQTDGIVTLYLRGGAEYNLEYETFGEPEYISVVENATSQTLNLPVLDYNEEYAIVTNDVKLDKLIGKEQEARIAQKDDILNTVDEKLSQIKGVDPQGVRLIMKQIVDEIIAKQKQQQEESETPINIPDLTITPDEATEFNEFAGLRISNITHMDPNDTDNELRTIFAPSRVFEFTSDGTFSIPELYDGLLAQVWVVTAFRNARGNNNNKFNAVIAPSVKVGYVVLKGNTTVPITVGSISSFGSYITNDGVDTKGLLLPSQLNLSVIWAVTRKSESNVENLIGTGGKVMIFV